MPGIRFNHGRYGTQGIGPKTWGLCRMGGILTSMRQEFGLDVQ